MSEQELLAYARDEDETGVRRLLNKKDHPVDVNAKDDHGLTPLLLATQGGHREVVRLLLQSNADPDDSDEDGNTALLLATQHQNREIIRLLLRKADVDMPNSQGRTALMYAASLAVSPRCFWIRMRIRAPWMTMGKPP
jgi:ankyrin repeat protein